LHFNKNAYIGNGYSLPEYYDFPYDTLYYDASNPYHWKIKDFHYRHYEQQADALTNIGFAKLLNYHTQMEVIQRNAQHLG